MHPAAPHRVVVAGVTAAAALLLLTAPTPAEAVGRLTQPGAVDAAEPLVALISLVAWALAGWLLLVVAVTAGAHLPGVVGSSLATVARRTAPAAARRTLEVALGLTVTAGVLAASPASAASGPEWSAPTGAPAAAPSLDWAEGTAGHAAAQDLDWAAPAPTPAATTPAPADRPADAPQPVVVQPGDSLWRLAAHDLGERGGEPPTAAEVAQAWPTWWAANRDAVGDDPHLLRPGTPLTPPSADGPSSPDAPAAS